MISLRLKLLALCLVSTSSFAQWHQHTFQVMGTRAHVEFWLDDTSELAPQTLVDNVIQEMERIERLMSPHIATSELSLLNRHAAQQTTKVSPELFQLLATAEAVSEQTGGAFDISYASIGYQYDYRNAERPDSTAIARALPAINFRAISLQPETYQVRFDEPNVRIDLGGIAKGYAVKTSMTILEKAGIQHALISAGGDTAILGDRGQRPWYVGIKHPRAANKTAVHLPLSNESISTSGDYERYFIQDGVRYHHIINPQTGDSARSVVSVSIIGKDATWVDALSTAVFVKGLNEGMALINRLPSYEAVIIDNQQRLHLSKGLQR